MTVCDVLAIKIEERCGAYSLVHLAFNLKDYVLAFNDTTVKATKGRDRHNLHATTPLEN